jgi:amino-acid N-acetyltransferase
MDWKAERARPEDLGPGLELIRRAGLPEADVAERFGNYFVVRDEGRVVGIGGLEVHGDDGLLRSLAVEAAYRGQGLGTLLVDAVLELSRLNQLVAVYLLTTTERAFFSRRGFVDCPRADAPAAIRDCWEFRTGCPKSAVFMKRALEPSTP